MDENFTKTRSRLDEKRDILQTNLCLTKITKKEFRQLVALADDKNALVRIQAYKSLSDFPCAETEIFLKRAMQSERDGQACAYAISSWVKVVLALFDEHSYDELFIKWLMKRKRIKKSEYCLLECYYALYRFGQTGYLAQILKLYRSKDNRVHVMIDSILGECMESGSKEIIKIMEKILITEESDAVRKEVIPLWKGLIDEYALSLSVKKE